MRTFIQGFRDSSLKLSVLQPPPIRKPPPPPPPIKGSLISKGILTLVSLPTNGVKFLSRAEILNFPPLYSKQIIKKKFLRVEIWHLFWKWDQSQNTF